MLLCLCISLAAWPHACAQETALDGALTLGAVRALLWRGGGDLVLRYRYTAAQGATGRAPDAQTAAAAADAAAAGAAATATAAGSDPMDER
jgi:hypothetical protein